MDFYTIARELAFLLPPETAHNLAHSVLKNLEGGDTLSFRCKQIPTEAFGRTLQNPIGLAAGFDKNGDLSEAILKLGFGFFELGSTTAKPAEGNIRPRMFRLRQDKALINRMGLPNKGVDDLVLKDIPAEAGISIAKTPDSSISGDNAIEDYLYSYSKVHDLGLYTAINVSCPNTEDGKTFEDPDYLKELLQALFSKNNSESKPLLVKFSPDADIWKLLEITEQFNVEGYVFSNTRKTRESLNTSDKTLEQIGAGGLSGTPLLSGTLKRVREARSLLPANKTIIAVGGVSNASDVSRALDSGANLVQMYTGLVYGGPQIVKKITSELSKSDD